MLTIAVFQSLLLLVQDHQLKNKHPPADQELPTAANHGKPAVQVSSGLAGPLLSLSLLSGCTVYRATCLPSTWPTNHLSCFAWVVFAGLWGRWQLGWRGHKAIR